MSFLLSRAAHRKVLSIVIIAPSKTAYLHEVSSSVTRFLLELASNHKMSPSHQQNRLHTRDYYLELCHSCSARQRTAVLSIVTIAPSKKAYLLAVSISVRRFFLIAWGTAKRCASPTKTAWSTFSFCCRYVIFTEQGKYTVSPCRLSPSH